MVLPAAAQEPQTPVFRGGVSLVKVDVQVTGTGGRIVPDLTAADFVIYDEGQPRKISYFAHEAEPVDVALLLDVSGSMQRVIRQLADAARAALSGLHQGDRVALMLFSRETAVHEPFTSDFQAVHSALRDAMGARGLGSGTAINAAIVSAAEYMAKESRNARRAVLIVTDNLSLNYKVPDEDVLRALYGADAVLNAILIGRQKRPDPPPPGRELNPDFTPSDVFKLAEETGGEAVEARRPGESFQQMIERIRARYSIHYEAPKASQGGFRSIKVELAPGARQRYPQAEVRARAGYYAAP